MVLIVDNSFQGFNRLYVAATAGAPPVLEQILPASPSPLSNEAFDTKWKLASQATQVRDIE